MKLYTTEIKAIRPSDSELITYRGPHVPGISFEDAQSYCEKNGLGYCKVDGILIAEIPCKKDSFEPDWTKMIDYENTQLN